MWLIRKINRLYFFYNYCYCITLQHIWKKRLKQSDEKAGSFFPILCFILYLFLLGVILWRCGVHASQSGPVMLWVNVAILLYGIYLGFQKKMCRNYFRKFDQIPRNKTFRLIILAVDLSPFMAILISLYLAKPFITN